MLDFFDLDNFGDRLRALGDVAWDNLYSIVLLLVLYLFYWNFAQGKDLLLILHQGNNEEIPAFFLSLFLLASICWFFPRFLSGIPKSDLQGFSWKKLLIFDLKDAQTTSINEHEKTVPLTYRAYY